MIPHVAPKLAAAAAAALVLAGCAAPNMDAALREAGNLAAPVAGGANVELAREPSQRADAARRAAELLSKPLTADGAVQLALANSPAFQAALAESWGELAAARQRGFPGGVAFSFERLREGADLELGRLLSVGLFDLITLAQRARVSQVQSEQARLRMASAIVDQATSTRQAWVRAVASREAEVYAVQVKDAAEARPSPTQRARSSRTADGPTTPS